VCFEGRGPVRHCWHHEDVLGGYAPARILVLIINAQRPFDAAWDPLHHVVGTTPLRPAHARALATYRRIRDGQRPRKLRFADEALRIFASRAAGEFADWVADHAGHKDWLPRATRLLLESDDDSARALLAKHFVFLDVYKHATPDADRLAKTIADHPLVAECPQRWLGRQIAVLRPAMLLLCGRPVIAKARELWMIRDEAGDALDPNRPMRDLHGAKWRAWLEGPDGPETETWTAYAVSNNTERPFWPKAPNGSTHLRAAIRRVIVRRA
jgi:hypothetical protein